MKWLIGIAAVIVALVLIVVVVGMLLPQAHVAATRAVIKAPQDAVWAAITDVAAYPTWRSDVQRVEVVQASGPKRWREVGRQDAILYEEVAAEAPQRLVTRIADDKLPFGGTWTYQLAPTAEGTEVRIREDGVVRNPIFRFMSRFVFGHYGTQETYLRALGGKFNTNVAPERVQ